MAVRLRTIAVCACALAAAAALATCAAAPSARSATAVVPVSQSKLLWATVNVCDTPDHPDTIGVRASMPGDGVAAESMFVRFVVQYVDLDGTWSRLPRGGDSGFVALGAAKAKVRETGRLFVLAPPMGRAYELRGIVTYEWRDAAGAVVRRLRRVTTVGHRSAAGADPQGFSAATCVMS